MKETKYEPQNVNKWASSAQKKLAQTGSPAQADRYANHVTKAAVHRRMRKQKPKGLG